MNQNDLEHEREPSGIEGKERPRNTKVMKFIEKTFNFLKQGSLSSIVSWNREGDGFVIKHLKKFTEEVLSKHFGHSNLSSFTRQLHLYGFRRSACEVNQCAFWHPLFKKSSSQKQLASIRRSGKGGMKENDMFKCKDEDLQKTSMCIQEIDTLECEREAQQYRRLTYQRTICISEALQPVQEQQLRFNNIPSQELLCPEFLSRIDDEISQFRELRLWLQRENEKDDGFEALLQSLWSLFRGLANQT